LTKTRSRLSAEEIRQRETDARRFLNLWKMLQVARNTVRPTPGAWLAVMDHKLCLAAMQPDYYPYRRRWVVGQ
jgi:hypothetical protein